MLACKGKTINIHFVSGAQKSLNSPTTILKPGNSLPPYLGSSCKAPFLMALRIQEVFKGILKYIYGNIFSPFKHLKGKGERSVVYPLNKIKKIFNVRDIAKK